MYLDALEFLDDERDVWRPFEALDGLTDDQLEPSVEGAHGWAGRDLIAHLIGWQEIALAIARELAVNETSPTIARVDAEWNAGGDAMNAAMIERWRGLPTDEVRRRLRTVPGELRGYLTVVPETRWLKNRAHLKSISEQTIDHYADHRADLAAILGAAGGDAAAGDAPPSDAPPSDAPPSTAAGSDAAG
jgi:Mycothiol maleylpyruvate isomerase N-terminal domain